MASAASPLSIIIESKNSSTASWDSDSLHPSPLTSHPFRIPTPSFSDLDIPSDLQYTSRPLSDMSIAGTRTSYLGGDLHDTVRHGNHLRRSRDDVAALIEFLRTHEPPASNFMSQPYSDEEEERGRWDKLKVMGKRRIAGVTTGGHRHIAISIPLNASHFGDDPKSQYPVFSQHGQAPVPPPSETVRTFKNKQGVVTVLRPLSPSQQWNSLPPSPASPRRFDRDYPPQLLRNRRMMPPSPPPSSPADSEHWPLAQIEVEVPPDGQQFTASYDTSEETASKGASRQPKEFVRAGYPSRNSSMAAPPRIKHHQASSIDEVIAEEEPYNRNPSPMPREGAVLRSTERRTGHPPISLTKSSVSRKATSSPRFERQADRETVTMQPRVTQVTESPVINRSPSPPASITSVKSRREKVRDKKLRDIAAARSSKMGKMQSPATAEVTDSRPLPMANSESGPKLSTIMVVVDMQPADEAASKESATTAPEDARSDEETRPESLMTLPTPPTSNETSPAQKHGFDTRTSLTRRREWQISRDQGRKQPEVAAAGAKVGQSSGALVAPRTSHGGMAVTEPERKILHLYEAYREQRLRDMESRVRRLERNGDLWLRALVPMLEDVRNSSTGAVMATGTAPHRLPGLEEESLRDCASDDETTGTAAVGATTNVDRLARASQRRRLIRRASLSRERMLEELMRREERDLVHQQHQPHQQPDVSGMGSIEPLMRELAGGGARPEPTGAPAAVTTQPRPTTTRRISEEVPPMPLRPRPASKRVKV
ncbi:hypothetical protein IF1G_07822 [Cordyceps javanica]|uniref:Uncharacterized protein n=1 Tax=Cordyceps javanica TaxID=43265 RepID=A0A545UUV7_9HYPO|nr:hypothetical protein IF1G_07822 [Cordyceps javanica]TQW05396.1 hypothetical protein IF2G_07333 [Cordyceps javanica]